MSHEYGYLDGELNEHEFNMKEMRERHEQEISAAMQAFEIKVAARRLYHEAPDDVFEMFVTTLSDVDQTGKGKGGLNVLRLVSKRCMQVVESVATRLTIESYVETLPVASMKRCIKIQHIRFNGRGRQHKLKSNLRSLVGCPDGLKSLHIAYGSSLESLEPLSVCKELETLHIVYATEISDLSPLSACTRLKKLVLSCSKATDISILHRFHWWKSWTYFYGINQPFFRTYLPSLSSRRSKS